MSLCRWAHWVLSCFSKMHSSLPVKRIRLSIFRNFAAHHPNEVVAPYSRSTWSANSGTNRKASELLEKIITVAIVGLRIGRARCWDAADVSGTVFLSGTKPVGLRRSELGLSLGFLSLTVVFSVYRLFFLSWLWKQREIIDARPRQISIIAILSRECARTGNLTSYRSSINGVHAKEKESKFG